MNDQFMMGSVEDRIMLMTVSVFDDASLRWCQFTMGSVDGLAYRIQVDET